MIEFENYKVSFINDMQRFDFSSDENGDYYFTLFCFNKNNNYVFLINNDDEAYLIFKNFIQSLSHIKKSNNVLNEYIIVKNNSVTFYDQNNTKDCANFVTFKLLEDKLLLIFNKPFPKSIRITLLGRQDSYPYTLTILNFFNELQNLKKITIKCLK